MPQTCLVLHAPVPTLASQEQENFHDPVPACQSGGFSLGSDVRFCLQNKYKEKQNYKMIQIQ